jgi:hypothetical protein
MGTQANGMTAFEMEVFRAGNYGEQGAYTEADLDAMAASYDPKRHEAPVVIGHPSTDSPAWGWARGFRRDGNILKAQVDVAPELANLIKQRHYTKRSIAVYRDFQGTGKPYVKHIGFLGATPPAVKGLADVHFAAGDDSSSVVIEFSETTQYKFETIAAVLDRLRDLLIEKYGQEETERILSRWQIDELKAAPEKNEKDGMPTAIYQEVAKNMESITLSEHEAKLKLAVDAKSTELTTQFAEKLKAETDQVTALKTENETLKAKVTQFEEAAQLAEITTFAEKLVSEGKLTPANKESTIRLLSKAKGANADLFAELQKNLENAAPVVEFGEFGGASGENAPSTGGATSYSYVNASLKQRA